MQTKIYLKVIFLLILKLIQKFIDLMCLRHAKVPGIVFARGPAVAVLILLDSNGETYAVLTEQVYFSYILQCT